MITVSAFQHAAAPLSFPKLTGEKYNELLGGVVLDACDTEPELLKIEQMQDHTRETVRLRLLSDVAAHQEHPELSFLKNLSDDLAAADLTDLKAIQSLFKKVALLDERIQYSFGNPPFLTHELRDISAVLEKFSVEDAIDYVQGLYDKTLNMYTHTEAFVLKPNGMQLGEKRPVVIVSHQHNAQYKTGKSETVGIEIEGQGNPIHATANDLVKQGYIVIAYDQLGFESRQHPVRAGLTWERWRSNGLENEGKTLLRNYISDTMRVVDYAVSRPDVDAEKVGTYGHSLGSWVTVNHAMLDNRVKVAVGNCGFPTVDGLNTYPEEYHCEPHSIPGIHRHGGFEAVFQVRQAPLVLHMNFGGLDVLNIEGEKVSDAAKAAFAGKPGFEFTSFIDEFAAHTNSPEMQKCTLATFQQALPVKKLYMKPANDLSQPVLRA